MWRDGVEAHKRAGSPFKIKGAKLHIAVAVVTGQQTVVVDVFAIEDQDAALVSISGGVGNCIAVPTWCLSLFLISCW